MNAVLAGHYQIVRPLGGGGFGRTFLARDSHLPGQPLCVVKQLKPMARDSTTFEVAKRLFDREAEILYRLGHHDQIPRLLAHFEQDQEFYLVQDYVAGQPLDREFVPDQPASEEAVVHLLLNILQVLSFVHEQQVIHRDIKPANLIRRSRDNRIVLIDFGAVKQVSTSTGTGSGQTSLTIAIGSPGYMPSEQQAFHPHFSSDIYAVGIVALQALTGLAPRSFPRHETTGEVCCATMGDRLSISPELAHFIDTMVRYDYRQRYANASLALAALQVVLGQEVAPPNGDPIGNPVGLDETEAMLNPFPSLTLAPPSEPPVPIPTPSTIPTDLKPQFERLLAEFIGPIAPLIFKTALNASKTPDDLITALEQRLPDPERSPFRQRALRLLAGADRGVASTQAQPEATAQPNSGNAPPGVGPASAIPPAFIQRCEVELARLVGPIASILIRRTLTQQPQLSPSGLVDALIPHIRDSRAAEQFRQLKP